MWTTLSVPIILLILIRLCVKMCQIKNGHKAQLQWSPVSILQVNKNQFLNNCIVLVWQALASLIPINLCSGFPGLYAILVCVACSQLEQLRRDLLTIRETGVKLQRTCLTAVEQEEKEDQSHCSEELFRDMQRQLNSCICHHQEIKWYGQTTWDGSYCCWCGYGN